MKNNYILILSFIIILFSACKKDENMITTLSENQEDLVNINNVSEKALSSQSGLPDIRFVKVKGTKSNYNVLFRANGQPTTVSAQVRVRYQNQNSSRTVSTSDGVAFNVDNMTGSVKISNIAFPLPVENTILSFEILYFENETLVNKSNFDAFVFSDGKTALQKPAFKVNNRGKVGRWIQSKADELANSASYSITVENDPAEEVASVEVLFDEKTGSPAPISLTNYLKSFEKRGNLCVLSGTIRFQKNPAGFLYQLKLILRDRNGNQIGNTITDIQKVGTGDFRGRIRRVRMVESGSGSNEYRIISILDIVNENTFGHLEIKFNAPISGPKANSDIFTLKKRPELLLSDWYYVIDQSGSISNDDYLTEINSKPIIVGNDPVYNPLIFEKPAVGYTYSVTATMYNKNGKQMGEPQTFDVTVEGETDKTEPVLLSTRLFSTDGGKTWNYEAVIQDNGQWVEKVQVEFVKPYEGPAPVYNPIGLTLVATKEGNIKMYSGKVEFDGNPAGFIYTAIINQFGSGTRTSAGQANNKAELL